MDKRSLTYGTLEEVVAGVCIDLDEGLEHFEKYLKWAMDMHRQWFLDSAREVRTKELTLNSYKAIDYPDDYVMWTKIGIRYKDTILAFCNDPEIPLAFDKDSSGNPIANAAYEDSDLVVPGDDIDYGPDARFYTNSYGEDLGKLYGRTVTGNYLGYFRDNPAQRQIQFRTRINSASKIYLEYIADGFNPCKNSFVHPVAVRLYELYIHMERIRRSRRYERARYLDAKQDFWDEFWRVQGRISEITPEMILESARGGYSLLPK